MTHENTWGNDRQCPGFEHSHRWNQHFHHEMFKFESVSFGTPNVINHTIPFTKWNPYLKTLVELITYYILDCHLITFFTTPMTSYDILWPSMIPEERPFAARCSSSRSSGPRTALEMLEAKRKIRETSTSVTSAKSMEVLAHWLPGYTPKSDGIHGVYHLSPLTWRWPFWVSIVRKNTWNFGPMKWPQCPQIIGMRQNRPPCNPWGQTTAILAGPSFAWETKLSLFDAHVSRVSGDPFVQVVTWCRVCERQFEARKVAWKPATRRDRETVESHGQCSNWKWKCSALKLLRAEILARQLRGAKPSRRDAIWGVICSIFLLCRRPRRGPTFMA